MFKDILDNPISKDNQPPKGEAWKSRATPSLRSLYSFQKLDYQTEENFKLFMSDVEPVTLTREEAPWMPQYAETYAVVDTDEEDIETHVTRPILDLSYPRAQMAKNHSQWISEQINAIHADLHEARDCIVLSDDEDILTQPVGLDSTSWKPPVRMPKNIYAASEREAAKKAKRTKIAEESYLARYQRPDFQYSAKTSARQSQSASSTDPPPTEPPWTTAYTAYPSYDTTGQASRQQAAENTRRSRQLMKKHPSITQAQQMSNFYCKWCGTTDHDSNACTFYCTDCGTYGHLTDKCPMWYTTKNDRAWCNMCSDYGHETHVRYCKLYQSLKTKYCKFCDVYGHWPAYKCQRYQ